MKYVICICLLSFLSFAVMAYGVKRRADKSGTDIQSNKNMKQDTIRISAGRRTFTAALVKNSSSEALLKLLAKGDMIIEMEDYARMEKVGSLGMRLPRNDRPTVTGPGDLILYQGHYLVIYYDHNSYTFTPLGKITDATQQELKDVLGSGDVTVTLSSDYR